MAELISAISLLFFMLWQRKSPLACLQHGAHRHPLIQKRLFSSSPSCCNRPEQLVMPLSLSTPISFPPDVATGHLVDSILMHYRSTLAHIVLFISRDARHHSLGDRNIFQPGLRNGVIFADC